MIATIIAAPIYIVLHNLKILAQDPISYSVKWLFFFYIDDSKEKLGTWLTPEHKQNNDLHS